MIPDSAKKNLNYDLAYSCRDTGGDIVYEPMILF